MHKYVMIVLFLAASVLGVYLLTTQLPGKPVEEVVPADTTLVKVEANSDFTFGEKEYKVKAGKVKLKLINKSGVHGLAIPDLGVDLQGDKLEQDLELKPGKYDMHCAVMCGTGHLDMKSVLIVE
ncbi:cytochrome C oxidase subunit II [Paenibacillus solisilvae]|uniref:Cytochrome C oxidase subunit II n=1 Tax=Paenibacillus solisilvae TaxID=2486751 RepID=A0ABW0VTL4_9BACL